MYYHFINQPYSTYGFFSNKKLSELTELGSSDSFYVAKKNSDVDQFEGVYSGDVIAKITVEGAGDMKEIVKNDGNVTLNVKHNSTNDKFMVSGSINSNTVGEVKLLATDFEYGSAKGIATLQGVSGDYSVSSANNYKEVVGDVKIHPGSVFRSDVASENTEVIGYDAVFGGQLK